ncbi:hypothetical protein ROJ8625_00054 [Roseivivax jejudonensis]|uniref:Uncharacterized protein n=1 Tax=Roseivivax jejudonensis TaxID=1529041 RepID=A0A1X6Y3D9_9RHOB|nr:hypothetical protein [Roseivivax jejudonensis]SLN09681.1 hypothetical protein ROJ8625_00054 [Roseivivax jejudonensis]
MTFDLPHMIVTAIIIFCVVWVVNHTGPFEGMTKQKRSLVLFGILFVVLLILNIVWPYGTTA